MLDIFFKIKMLQQSHKFITSFFSFFQGGGNDTTYCFTVNTGEAV